MLSFWDGFDRQADEVKGLFSQWAEEAEDAHEKAKELGKRDVRVSPRELSEDHGPDAHQRYNP